MNDGRATVYANSGDAAIKGHKRAADVRARLGYGARHRARRSGVPAATAAAILVLGACARPSVRAMPARRLAPGPALGVLRQGWHTGLVVPEIELSGALRPLRAGLAEAPFAVIGWGERRYYMTRHPGPLSALGALFPSHSVVYVRGWRPRPSATQRVTWLRLGTHGWHGLRAFLGRVLAHAPQGGLEGLGAHGRRGLFFASTDTYDAFHTCNTWIMQALRAAHLPAASTGVLFAGQVSAALRAAPLRRFRGHGPRAHARPSSVTARAHDTASPVRMDAGPRTPSANRVFPRTPKRPFLDKRRGVTY